MVHKDNAYTGILNLLDTWLRVWTVNTIWNVVCYSLHLNKYYQQNTQVTGIYLRQQDTALAKWPVLSKWRFNHRFYYSCFFLDESIAPDSPFLVSADSITQTSAIIRWYEPFVQNGPISFYRVTLMSSGTPLQVYRSKSIALLCRRKRNQRI